MVGMSNSFITRREEDEEKELVNGFLGQTVFIRNGVNDHLPHGSKRGLDCWKALHHCPQHH
jgi:hypothetical protein